MDEIEAAAVIALAGMNPMRFLCEPDSFIRSTMQQIALRCHQLADDARQDLAVKIINQLGKSIK